MHAAMVRCGTMVTSVDSDTTSLLKFFLLYCGRADYNCFLRKFVRKAGGLEIVGRVNVIAAAWKETLIKTNRSSFSSL